MKREVKQEWGEVKGVEGRICEGQEWEGTVMGGMKHEGRER